MAYPEIETEVISNINSNIDKANAAAAVAQQSITALATLTEEALAFDNITYSLTTNLGAYDGPTSSPIEPGGASGITAPTIGAVDAITPVVLGTTPDTSLALTGAPTDETLTYNLPAELASLTLPDFSGLDFSEMVSELVATYVYTEPTYVDQLKDETHDVILNVLNGSLIVPTATWDALFDRAAGDATAIQVAEEWAATNLAAAAGMTGMVSETLLARLDAAEQRANENMSKVRLEQAVQEAVQRREDYWNGVRESISFESMWIQQHEGIAGRALASAAKAHEALVATYTANIQRFNAYVQLSAQNVALGSLRLESALVPLEEYKVKLERERLQLESNDMKLKKWLGEWDGWKTEKSMALSLMEKQISGYTANFQGQGTRQRGDIDTAQLGLAKSEEDIRLYSAKYEALKTDAAAVAQLLNARVGKYAAEVNNALGQTRFASLWLEKDKEAAAQGLKKDLTIAELQTNAALGTVGKIADLQTGIAQGFLSASDVSLSAGASAGVSWGQSIRGDCSGDVSCIPV